MTITRFASRLAGIGCLLCSVVFNAHAQTPRLINAKTETRVATGDFAAQLRDIVHSQKQPGWIGYSVPAVEGDHQMCCGSYHYGEMMNCGVCNIENDNEGMSVRSNGSNPSRTVKLEGPEQMIVMIRAENGGADRVRTFSEDCQLDAGGLPVIWLTNVSASQSVAALGTFATSGADNDENRVRDSAIAAIALTGDPSADQMLQSFAAPGEPESLRERAAFWLGAARGHAGFEALKKLAREDTNDDLRAKVAFDLSVNQDPAATDEMIRMAKADHSSHVREQAIFWVAQKAGKKAEAVITSAIENDPDTEVKKRAVFGLSQLPREEGVPLLIHVAKTNSNPAVRKQAIFWLGQSHDPRALEFFQEILSR